MSKVGGAREGAGRPPGSLNRRSVELAAEALAEGLTPLEYMLRVLRDESAPAADRAWAAEKAAPFIHPRPTPLERTIEIDLPDTSTIAGIDAALDVIIAAVAGGEISPAEGQSLMAMVETRRKAIETGDLMERIKALEERAGAQGYRQ